MRFRRSRLRIQDPHEISLVGRGANLKKFLVHKSEDEAAPSAADVFEEILKADWEESKHPRGEGGKFGAGGGGGGDHTAAAREHKKAGDRAMLNVDHAAAIEHYNHAVNRASAAMAAHADGSAEHKAAMDIHVEASQQRRAAKRALKDEGGAEARRAEHGDSEHRTSSGKVIPDASDESSAHALTHDGGWNASDHEDAAKHFYDQGHHRPAREHEQEARRLRSTLVKKDRAMKTADLDADSLWLLEFVAKELGPGAREDLVEGRELLAPDAPTEDQQWVIEQVEKAFGRRFAPRPPVAANPRMAQAMARQPVPARQPPMPAAAPPPPQQQPVIAQQTAAPPVSPAADPAHPLSTQAQLPMAAGGGLSDPAQGALKAVARILAPHKGEITADDVAGVLDGIGIPTGSPDDEDPEDQNDGGDDEEAEGEPPAGGNGLDANPEYVALSLDSETQHGEVDPMAMDLSAFPPAQRTQMEAVLKSLAADQAATWEAEKKALIEKNEAMEKRVNEEHERRVMKEYVAKAESFDRIGADTEKLARVLKALETAGPELRADLEAVLKGLNEQIALNDELGGLMSEQGSRLGGGSGGGAQAKLDALIDGYVAKSEHAGKSRHQIAAIVQKSAEGRKLVHEVDRENEQRKRRFGAA